MISAENSYKIIENRHACGVPVFKISIKICGKGERMKFRTKLIMGFSCVVFAISAVMGILYFQYNTRRLTEIENQNMRFYAEQLGYSIDGALDSMKNATDYILSDPDMLNAMQSIPVYRDKGDDFHREEMLDTLTAGITLDYINKNFYRILIFNESGDVACSTNVGNMIIDKERDTGEISWLEEAAEKYGQPVIVAPHKDGWGERQQIQVYSLGRKVQGGDFGYIEVQSDASNLESIFQLPDTEVEVAAWLPDGTLFYTSGDLEEKGFLQYMQAAKREDDVASMEKGGYLLSYFVSDDFGIQVLAAKDRRNSGIFEDIKQLFLFAGVLTIACFAGCMIAVVIIANKLAKPIESLRSQMENTGIENLDRQTLALNADDDEVKALGIAYQNLLRRLNESMIKERRLSVLQLQAQFDTLQAQVNPHFLYNVLNTISNRGIINEDEVICEICGSLAAMLRYSSNNKERYATVKEELDYLDKYVYLLKSRYEHRLEVEVDVSSDILQEILPKVVLQQLVENSIQHGFTNGMSVMKIRVSGWRDKNAWFIQVKDNGEGITPEVKRELEKKMTGIRERIMRKSSSIEMEIGGMGLANTYARLFLIYAEDVVFEMENKRNGFCITIGVDRKDGTEHVPSNGSR